MKNTYQIDSAHSQLQFSVRHLMVSNVRGTFRSVTGVVNYDPANPGATTVDATIDVNSINTNDEKRDEHLKAADFFDAAKFPTITFKSKRVEKTGAGEFKVVGDLTIHGVTKEETLAVEEVSDETKDLWGNTKIGASAKTKIKRSDFGLTWNAPLETGGVVVSDDVKLEFDLQFLKAQTTAV
jgi:polyisoprenoid-binding protein YceI